MTITSVPFRSERRRALHDEAPLSRPVIQVVAGELPRVVDGVERAILRNYARCNLYQRGSHLVQVVVATANDDPRKYVRRELGSVILRAATQTSLLELFEREVTWQNFKGYSIDCPTKVAVRYLSRTGEWHLPVLVGVVEAPVMRPDGSVLIEPGYDPATGLLLQSTAAWLPQSALTRETAHAAAVTAGQVLLKPFAEFPMSPEARSVIISAILTALQRRLLFSAPVHAFDAPTQGSGKSLLADVIGIVATGRRSTSISANVRDKEEFRKTLISILIAGDPVVNIDNNTKPLKNDTLATIVTLPAHSDRILGASVMVEVITNVLFLATGNNLVFSGDMPSRVLVCRIEPDCERPEDRGGFTIPNLRKYVLDNRAELVQAAMTILQAYVIAGRPPQGVKEYGRFEQWSQEIRGAMIFADLPDPCATREDVIAGDPDRDAALDLFGHWWRTTGECETLLRDLVKQAVGEKNKDGEHVGGDVDLRSALLEIASDSSDRQRVNSWVLAAWCRERVGRVIGEFKLSRGGTGHGGSKKWKVTKVGAAAAAVNGATARPAEQEYAKQMELMSKEPL